MYVIFTYIYPQNGPNAGKYSIHGASGLVPEKLGRKTDNHSESDQILVLIWNMMEHVQWKKSHKNTNGYISATDRNREQRVAAACCF